MKPVARTARSLKTSRFLIFSYTGGKAFPPDPSIGFTSRTLKNTRNLLRVFLNCARGGSRTRMTFRSTDFKSVVYTIPPLGREFVNIEAAVGIAPTYVGFADQSVSYFATPPL